MLIYLLKVERANGYCAILDWLEPLSHNKAWWAKRLRGEARGLKKANPSDTFFIETITQRGIPGRVIFRA